VPLAILRVAGHFNPKYFNPRFMVEKSRVKEFMFENY
jgi:hypothetical protein